MTDSFHAGVDLAAIPTSLFDYLLHTRSIHAKDGVKRLWNDGVERAALRCRARHCR